jgi:co-chaperonin GroES (HSP10)
MNTVHGDITPLKNKVLVKTIEKGDQLTKGGLIIPDDDGKDRGIRARWAQVYRTGKHVDFLKEGQWVLVEHGYWTRGFTINTGEEKFDCRLIDNEHILGVQDEKPENINV